MNRVLPRLRHAVRLAAAMPPGALMRKLAAWLGRTAFLRLAALARRGRCPYAAAVGALRPRLGFPDVTPLRRHAPILRELSERYRRHHFDLLGSGWVRVAHGEVHAGFGGHGYGPGPALPEDWRGAIAAALPPGARPRARAILERIADPAYRPVDWHADFKSGFRWSPATWGGAIAFGHLPGVDVKVPWELARMQHTPHLAMAAALAGAGEPGFAPPGAYRDEFRHQVLDFLGSNPPGWGVDWACPMDVAIRAANLALAWDLFRAQGMDFDVAFEAELAAGLMAHGRHVAANLEWTGEDRGNHYLADLCGLAFIAAYLPPSAETEGWRDLAVRELDAEILRQFLPDGGNFEASTAYHRLSAEMALFAVAVLGGPSAAARRRLAAAARFSAATVKPSGRLHQVGDNDSGRFFKLSPLYDLTPDGPAERLLDSGGLLAAAEGLLPGCGRIAAETAWEAAVIRALAGKAVTPASPPPLPAPPRQVVEGRAGRRLRIRPPDPVALEGLEALAFPDFGLYVWRNARCYLAVRCGPIGQNGRGGHAHNDQLAVELEIDGIDWAADPGSFVYTPDLEARNRYRSALAHAVPRNGTAEPARLLSPFRLEDRAKARCLRFVPDFVGCHLGFGAPIHRRVAVEEGEIVVEDWPARKEERTVASPGELSLAWGLSLPFSSGYGVRNAPRG